MDLRCDNIKFAEIVAPGVIEMKCRSARCGAQKGVVVIHGFDVVNNKLLYTKRFKDPRRE